MTRIVRQKLCYFVQWRCPLESDWKDLHTRVTLVQKATQATPEHYDLLSARETKNFHCVVGWRRLWTRHRLRHVRHRFVRSPTQPSHFVKTAHWLCQGYESSPWYTPRHTHNRGIVRSFPSLTPGEAASFRCYSS